MSGHDKDMATEISDIIKTLKNINGSFSHENMDKAIRILEELEDNEMLLKRLDATQAIWAYYVASKATGHSRLLREGLDHSDNPCVVVLGAGNQRGNYEEFKCVTYDNLQSLVGVNVPLAWDNAAIVRLVSSLSPVQSAFRRIQNILNG